MQNVWLWLLKANQSTKRFSSLSLLELSIIALILGILAG